MSEVKTVLVIDKDSRVADVAAYVGAKPQSCEFVVELQKFIIDQAPAVIGKSSRFHCERS
jgi:hypothetical protein